jgi:hypothetical protein
MEVGQGPNWGCSAKEKNIDMYGIYIHTVCTHGATASSELLQNLASYLEGT